MTGTGTGTMCVWLPSGPKNAGPVCSVKETPRVSLLIATVPSVTRVIQRACRRVHSARVEESEPGITQEIVPEDRQGPGALDLQPVPLVLLPVVQRVLDEDDRELGGRP